MERAHYTRDARILRKVIFRKGKTLFDEYISSLHVVFPLVAAMVGNYSSIVSACVGLYQRATCSERTQWVVLKRIGQSRGSNRVDERKQGMERCEDGCSMAERGAIVDGQ